MITLAEAKADFRAIREFPFKERGKDFEVLWHCNYWDGMLSGVVRMGSREFWTECVLDGVVALSPEPDEGYLNGRNFAIVQLDDDQIKELYARHKDFQESVGTHTDYTGGKRALGAHCKDMEGYYKRAKERPPMDFSGNEVVAWWGRMSCDAQDMLYDMISDQAAEKLWVSTEAMLDRAESRRKHEQWWTEFFANDPLYLAFIEELKDPVLTPEKYHGIGVTHSGWDSEFTTQESRYCQRIISKTPTQPYTIDFEWAVKTGPVKLSLYKDGKVHEDKFFRDHSVENIKAAFAYAKQVIAPKCEHREWLPTDDEDEYQSVGSGPQCTEVATHLSCVPHIDTPTCQKHKCRCNKPKSTS